MCGVNSNSTITECWKNSRMKRFTSFHKQTNKSSWCPISMYKIPTTYNVELICSQDNTLGNNVDKKREASRLNRSKHHSLHHNLLIAQYSWPLHSKNFYPTIFFVYRQKKKTGISERLKNISNVAELVHWLKFKSGWCENWYLDNTV